MTDITKAAQAIAAKGFIFNENDELLLIKRRDNDAHSPGIWEVPGGRIDIGEDPIAGVKREVREETQLEVIVQEPLGVRSFTRDDGQHITMIVFRCSPETYDVILSEEHTDFVWKPVSEARDMLHPAFASQIDAWEAYYKGC